MPQDGIIRPAIVEIVEAQFGDYDGMPFTPDAAEIVTVAVLRD